MDNREPDYAKAKEEAEKLIEKYCIYTPPVIAGEIARDRGLRIMFADFTKVKNGILKNVSGFINSENNTMYIAQEPSKRQNFTIAHELGHYVLGHTEQSEYDNLFRLSVAEKEDIPIEQEANCFAANLLVPERFLKDFVKKYPFAADYELGNIFGVSDTVIRIRKKFLRL